MLKRLLEILGIKKEINYEMVTNVMSSLTNLGTEENYSLLKDITNELKENKYTQLNKVINDYFEYTKRKSIQKMITTKLKDIDYDLILEMTKELNDEKYSQINSVFNQISEKFKQEYYEYDRFYFLDNEEECSLDIVLHALSDKSQGEKDIEIKLLNKIETKYEKKEIYENFKLKAYYMDSEQLEIIKLYSEKAHYEGFTFKFVEDLTTLHKPECYLDFISDTFTVEGNCIDSNCDTYATSYRVNAERLYMLYISDLDKLIGVECTYECY